MIAFEHQMCDCQRCPYWRELGVARANLALSDRMIDADVLGHDDRVIDDFFQVAEHWRLARARYLRHFEGVDEWRGVAVGGVELL